MASTSGTMIVMKMWFFSASVVDERWAQVNGRKLACYERELLATEELTLGNDLLGALDVGGVGRLFHDV